MAGGKLKPDTEELGRTGVQLIGSNSAAWGVNLRVKTAHTYAAELAAPSPASWTTKGTDAKAGAGGITPRLVKDRLGGGLGD